MNCKIELIDPKTNKSIKQKIISGNYIECENKVTKLNERIKNEKFWKLTQINI